MSATGEQAYGPGPGTLVTVLPPGSPLLCWNGFPVAFALTCVIELPAYLGAFARSAGVAPGRARTDR